MLVQYSCFQEKNVDWLAEDRLTELAAYGFDKIDYSKESGFPLALDLSSYYTYVKYFM